MIIQSYEAIEDQRFHSLSRCSLRGSRWPLARVDRGKAFAHLDAKVAANLRPRRCRRKRGSCSRAQCEERCKRHARTIARTKRTNDTLHNFQL